MGVSRLISIFGIAVSLLFCSLAYAEVPWRKFSYFDNRGGLNDQLSAIEIADNEASDIQNVVFDSGGAIKKRYGYTTIPTTSSIDVSRTIVGITGLAFYKKDDTNRYLVAIAVSDNAPRVYRKTYDVGGGLPNTAWIDITKNLPTTGYSVDYLADFVEAQDTLVLTLDATIQQKPFKWTGTGEIENLTSDADCPAVTIVEYHKNHLCLSGNDTYPSRVYFSELDDITTYTATDFFDVDTSDGTRVRGLLSTFDALYIFKDYSIWRLTGTNRDDFVLEKVVTGIGTMSQQSIAVVNNLIYFTTSKNDIAVYDGAYTIKFISSKIRETISGLNFSRTTNNLGIAFSTYRHNDFDYYCAVSLAGSGTNNRVLLFDTAYGAWTKFKGMNANAWVVGEDSSGKGALFFGDYYGNVHQYPATTYDDGSLSQAAIDAYYQTKWFRYPDIALGDKYWRLLRTYTLTETSDIYLNAELRSDYETTGEEILISLYSGGSLWDSAIWDEDTWAGQTLNIDREEVEKGKDMFQIKYSNDTLSEGFTIIGFDMFIEPTDRI